MLWYGEQDTRFRLDGTVFLHDALMYLSVVIVAGHLYLSLIHPSTRHALRGMTLGTVRADWAQTHHAKWTRPKPNATTNPPATIQSGQVTNASAVEQPATRTRR